MKEEYILVSSDGPDRNVLKFKPPMVFTQSNAEHVAKILDEVLTEISDIEVWQLLNFQDQRIELRKHHRVPTV